MKLAESFYDRDVFGRPAFVVRLSGCNLNCLNCLVKDVIKYGRDISAEEIAKVNASRIVVTGGEPLLQKDAVATLADAKPVVVETNGTVLPDFTLKVQWVVSPKLTNTGMKSALNTTILKAFDRHNAVFRFFVGNDFDVAEVYSFVKLLGIKSTVVLQPDLTRFNLQNIGWRDACNRWLKRVVELTANWDVNVIVQHPTGVML